jgi:hypothetical protein
MTDRIKNYLNALEEYRWEDRCTGGRDYAVHLMEQELEEDPMALGGAQPNRRGLKLLTAMQDLRFHSVMALAFLVLGYDQEEAEEFHFKLIWEEA